MNNLEKIEQASKRIHLLLYASEKNNSDPQYIEWRADLEVAIAELLEAHLNYYKNQP